MLQVRRLSNQFWAKAIVTSVCQLNLSPTKAVMNQTLIKHDMEGNHL